MLQGVTDCCLVEPAGLVVIDFKTDRVTAQTQTRAAAYYQGQLDAYAKALAEIFQKPVQEKLLYFFATEAGGPGLTKRPVQRPAETEKPPAEIRLCRGSCVGCRGGSRAASAFERRLYPAAQRRWDAPAACAAAHYCWFVFWFWFWFWFC